MTADALQFDLCAELSALKGVKEADQVTLRRRGKVDWMPLSQPHWKRWLRSNFRESGEALQNLHKTQQFG